MKKALLLLAIVMVGIAAAQDVVSTGTVPTKDIIEVEASDVFTQNYKMVDGPVYGEMEYEVCNPTEWDQSLEKLLDSRFAYGGGNIKSVEYEIWKDYHTTYRVTCPFYIETNKTVCPKGDVDGEVRPLVYPLWQKIDGDILKSGQCAKVKARGYRSKPALDGEYEKKEDARVDIVPQATLSDADGKEVLTVEDESKGWWNATWGYRVPLDVSVQGHLNAKHFINGTWDFQAALSALGYTYTDQNETLRLVMDDNMTEIPVAFWASRKLLFFQDNFTTSLSKRYWLYFDDVSSSVPSTSAKWNHSNVDWCGGGSDGTDCANPIYDRRTGVKLGWIGPWPASSRLALWTNNYLSDDYGLGSATYQFFAHYSANYRYSVPWYDDMTAFIDNGRRLFVSSVVNVFDCNTNSSVNAAYTYWGYTAGECALWGYSDPDHSAFVAIGSISNVTLTSSAARSDWTGSGTSDTFGLQDWGENSASDFARCCYNNGQAGAEGTTTCANWRAAGTTQIYQGFRNCYSTTLATYNYHMVSWDISPRYRDPAGWRINSRVDYNNYWMQNPGPYTLNNPEDIGNGELVYWDVASIYTEGELMSDSLAQNVTEAGYDQGTYTFGSTESGSVPVPTYSSDAWNVTSIVYQGAPFRLASTTWTSMSYGWVEHNKTGSYVNGSYTEESPVTEAVDFTGYGEQTICFRSHANNTDNKQNSTAMHCVYVTSSTKDWALASMGGSCSMRPLYVTYKDILTTKVISKKGGIMK